MGQLLGVRLLAFTLIAIVPRAVSFTPAHCTCLGHRRYPVIRQRVVQCTATIAIVAAGSRLPPPFKPTATISDVGCAASPRAPPDAGSWQTSVAFRSSCPASSTATRPPPAVVTIPRIHAPAG
jgi:hypothetical protein